MIDLTEARWKRSSRGRGCVEVAVDSEQAVVRDGKNPHGPVLRFSRAAFAAFLADVTNDVRDR